MKIKGKTALITGASGKLGYYFALELAKNGCNCICQYHTNSAQAYNLVEKIEQTGGKAVAVEADLTSAQQIERLFQEYSGFQTSQILINSASIFQRSKLEELSVAEIEKVLSLNVTAVFGVIQQFQTQLSSDADVAGKIVNIADIAGELNWANYSLYCASKAALISMTESLAKELAPKVLVNAISPGIVDWPESFTQEDKLRQLKKIPLFRKAQYTEVTQALMFLLDNDYVTGQVLKIDGGRSL